MNSGTANQWLGDRTMVINTRTTAIKLHNPQYLWLYRKLFPLGSEVRRQTPLETDQVWKIHSKSYEDVQMGLE